MIAVDTNILVYAHRRDLPQHAPALQAIQRLVADGRTWAVPWPCIHEFLAVVTNPQIFKRPTSTQTAIRVASELGAQPRARLLGESQRHLDILDRQVVHRGLASGAYELEDYMGLAQAILVEWAPEQVANREERRAATKAAPAKRAVRTPRRPR